MPVMNFIQFENRTAKLETAVRARGSNLTKVDSALKKYDAKKNTPWSPFRRFDRLFSALPVLHVICGRICPSKRIRVRLKAVMFSANI